MTTFPADCRSCSKKKNQISNLEHLYGLNHSTSLINHAHVNKLQCVMKEGEYERGREREKERARMEVERQTVMENILRTPWVFESKGIKVKEDITVKVQG